MSRRGVLAGLAGLGGFPVFSVSASPFEPWPGLRGPAPVLPDLAGDPVAIGPVPGRITIVHAFATWCETCRDDLVALDRLAADRGGLPVSVIAVSIGEPPVRVRRYFAAAPVTFPVVLDEARVLMKAWDVVLFPTSFVFTADGAGRWRVEGEVPWHAPETLVRLTGPAKAGSIPATQNSSGGTP